MRRAAFLSMSHTEGWCIYDDLLVDPLSQRGWQIDARVPWREFATVDWSLYEVVVVRSVWDYQDDVKLFFEALAHIQAAGCRIENSVELMRWNANKLYLADVAQADRPIIPTIIGGGANAAAKPPASELLRGALSSFEEVVIKPAVGASSFDTFRVVLSDLDAPFEFTEDPAVLELRGRPTNLPNGQTTFATKAAFFDALYGGYTEPFLIQPFIRDITTEGEYALFYFGGKFSHAMRKVPNAGDFRVQEEYGAIHQQLSIDELRAGVIETAMAGLQSAAERSSEHGPPLYARVDVVGLSSDVLAAAKTDSRFLVARSADTGYALMEIELIEPSLYFNIAAHGITNFCEAFCHRFSRSS